MRRWFALLLALCGIVAGASQTAEGPIKPAKLDNSEPGVYRCTFEAAPPAGMVMVVRETMSRGNYVYSKRDVVNYTSGDKLVQKIVFRDPSQTESPPTNDGKPTSVTFEALSGSGELTGMRVSHASLNENILTFDFVNEGGELRRIVFEGFIESYASAKARIPDLTEMPKRGDIVTGWMHSADLRKKKKR